MPGKRKLLCFNFRVWNKGNKDLLLGDPEDHKKWFYYSDCADHDHFHLKDFNAYEIFGPDGSLEQTQKQGFCLEDTRWKGPAAKKRKRFNCDYQGVSAGWYDTYPNDLDCQWVDITGLDNGDYVLRAETNPVRPNGRRLVKEDTYADNVVLAGVRITGNKVARLRRLPFEP